MKTDNAIVDREEILTSFAPLLSACGVTTKPSNIISSSRKSELVHARAIIAHCLRDYGFSLDTIAYILNRDRTTVMYLLNRPHKFGVAVVDNRSSFKGSTLSVAIHEAVISYHKNVVQHHQGIISKLQK